MTGTHDVLCRRAAEADLPAIVELLADDILAAKRNPLFADAEAAYRSAFTALEGDDNHIIVAAWASAPSTLIGCYQLTFIRGLSFRGGLRAQIESVRVARPLRGNGLGTRLMLDALTRAQDRGAFMVQLTTDQRRPKTRSFYERLGFEASHHGMKFKF